MRSYLIAALCLLLGTSNSFSQVSITQLPNATTPLGGTEVVAGVQNGQTVQIPETAFGVQGPSSSTNNHIATFSGTSGRLIQDGGALGPYGQAAQGQLPGTVTNDSASAGNIGQYISSTIAIGSPVALTTATPVNITSISLTAGDWDVWGFVGGTGNAATTVSYLTASISLVTGTMDNTPDRVGLQFLNGSTPFTSVSLQFSAGKTRVSVSTTTTVYLVGQAGFATNTMGAFGFIGARRVR